MPKSISQQIADLRNMTPAQLRQKHLEVFGEPCRTGNKDFLVKRIAWRIQSLAEGGLSERARQRAAELARDADIQITAPREPRTATVTSPRATAPPTPKGGRLPIPGTVLTRQYRGRTIAVTVLRDGFEYDGQSYKSLSAVAKAVTGSHWNGHLFFGLRNGGKQ